jgi:hypothetical protein
MVTLRGERMPVILLPFDSLVTAHAGRYVGTETNGRNSLGGAGGGDKLLQSVQHNTASFAKCQRFRLQSAAWQCWHFKRRSEREYIATFCGAAKSHRCCPCLCRRPLTLLHCPLCVAWLNTEISRFVVRIPQDQNPRLILKICSILMCGRELFCTQSHYRVQKHTTCSASRTASFVRMPLCRQCWHFAGIYTLKIRVFLDMALCRCTSRSPTFRKTTVRSSFGPIFILTVNALWSSKRRKLLPQRHSTVPQATWIPRINEFWTALYQLVVLAWQMTRWLKTVIHKECGRTLQPFTAVLRQGSYSRSAGPNWTDNWAFCQPMKRSASSWNQCSLLTTSCVRVTWAYLELEQMSRQSNVTPALQRDGEKFGYKFRLN